MKQTSTPNSTPTATRVTPSSAGKRRNWSSGPFRTVRAATIPSSWSSTPRRRLAPWCPGRKLGPSMSEHDEGADLPLLSGEMPREYLELLDNHQLIAGKTYGCQVCGKSHEAPFVRRCVCGMRVCENCAA